MWTLATITSGIDQIGGLATGRHVYVSIVRGMVRVIGAGGVTAILTVDCAKRHLHSERRNGRIVHVRDQSIRWDQLRGGRRFIDHRCGRFDVAA